MSFQKSLAQGKTRSIILVFFCLAGILPLLITVFIVLNYLDPELTQAQRDVLSGIFFIGLGSALILLFLSFLLIHQWLKSLETLASDIISKSAQIAVDRTSLDKEDPEAIPESPGPPAAETRRRAGNEIEGLIQSFEVIFQSAESQAEERDRLRSLLSKLVGVASEFTSELDFNRLIPRIVRNVTDVMAAERTSLYVVDHDLKEIWTTVAEGIPPLRLPFGQGISGRVAETGDLINVADAWQLPYFDRSFDEKNRFRTKSVLCMPVRGHQGDIIGVLQVINKKGKDRFDREDEAFMRALSTQVGIALENSLLVEEVTTSFNNSISTLSAIVDARHHYTAGHSKRVMEISLTIAEHINMDNGSRAILQYAALLHDIGKVGIRDEVLQKNGTFTDDDWREMKSHPIKTYAILKELRFPRHLRRVPEIACLHHEKINGEGYPEGLRGDAIPIESKIIGVADMFDAVTSRRDYPKYTTEQVLTHDPMPLPKVIELLQKLSGNEYDPLVVDALLRCLPEILITYRGSHYTPEYVDATIGRLRS